MKKELCQNCNKYFLLGEDRITRVGKILCPECLIEGVK